MNHKDRVNQIYQIERIVGDIFEHEESVSPITVVRIIRTLRDIYNNLQYEEESREPRLDD